MLTHHNAQDIGNRTVLSEEALEETYKPYTKISDTASYAMGWLTLNFKKQKILTHDGGLDGFLSNVSFIPEKKLGVVILTGSSEIAPQQIAMRIWQYLLRIEEKTDFVRASIAQSRKANEEAIKQYPDTDGVSLDRPIEFFVGEFCNSLYGKATISKTNAQTLHLKMNLFDVDLYSRAPLKFSIRNMHSELKYINFTESADHEISSIQWKLEATSNEPVVFQRCLAE